MSSRKDQLLIEAFNDCCERLIAGESIAACMERYADCAAELAPLLAALGQVRTLRAVPPRAAEVAAIRRAGFMAAAQQMAFARAARQSAPLAGVLLWWEEFRAGLANFGRQLPRAMPAGLAIALLLFVLSGLLTTGAVVVSANALPGDGLYGIKTATEQARLLLARDTLQRTALLERFDQERLREAQAVSRLHRTVRTLRFAGEIQAIDSSGWIVSNLTVAITPDTQISGIPEVGGRAMITAMAPGNGTLIALYIAAGPAKPEMRQATPGNGAPTATDTAASKISASPTPASTVTPASPPVLPAVSLADSPLEIPTEAPIGHKVPTASPSATRTPTRLPTRTPTPLRTTTPSATTEPRERVTGQFYGQVKRIESSRWTVDEVTVDTDADTVFAGDPGVGDRVEVRYLLRPESFYLALEIRKLESKPEPVEFTGMIEAIADDQWTISGNVVRIRVETDILGSPQVDDVVEFKGVRQSGGEIWATRIRLLTMPEYEFEGVVESIAGDTWIIAGQTVRVNGDTQIIGDPGVGSYVQIRVVQMPDDSLVAKVIFVVPDTPTPTQEPTAAPTTAETLAPTATDTQVPPMPTDTVAPATDTPGPTDTLAPATDTPTPTRS